MAGKGRRERAAKTLAEVAEVDAAEDAGRRFFAEAPEAMLILAYRRAQVLYERPHERDAFVDGFRHARRQRDDFNAEAAS